MRMIKPMTFLIGCSTMFGRPLAAYLKRVDAESFLDEWREHHPKTTGFEKQVGLNRSSITSAEVMVSMYAKLCYKSLTLGKNPNVSKIRSVEDNLRAVIASGHGSVLEHVSLNFVTTGCSRVFTHELVRHRTGVAFSQTSGRYVRQSDMEFVWDPVLDEICDDAEDYLDSCAAFYSRMCNRIFNDPHMSFDRKKKLTSALRRFLPHGIANEIGWTVNIRQLRHMIMMRTSEHAEWEMRFVFSGVYQLLKDSFPLFVHDAKERITDDGLLEITGMKVLPY